MLILYLKTSYKLLFDLNVSSEQYHSLNGGESITYNEMEINDIKNVGSVFPIAPENKQLNKLD